MLQLYSAGGEISTARRFADFFPADLGKCQSNAFIFKRN